jgi:hypothetical protein
MATKRKAVPSKTDKARTLVHLSETVAENLAHAKRHVAAGNSARSAGSKEFNKQHAAKHLKDAEEHATKLRKEAAKGSTGRAEARALKRARPGG